MGSNPQATATQPYRPTIVGPPAPPQNFGPPVAMQFRPAVPVQQTMQFIPAPSQHFRPMGQITPIANVGVPSGQAQPLQYPQQLPPRPDLPFQGSSSSQGLPMPYIQPSRPATFAPVQPQPNVQPINNHLPGFGGTGTPISSSYTFATYSQPQNNTNPPLQYHPVSQMQTSVMPMGAHAWGSSGAQSMPSFTPLVQSVQTSVAFTPTIPPPQHLSDWQEHTSADGKKYYYNKKTKQSSWEKPLELMTALERADASTDWKEFTSPEGRKYFYNKVTKQSKWTIPEEVKLAREKIEKASAQTTISEAAVNPPVPSLVVSSSTEMPSSLSVSSSTVPATGTGEASSPATISITNVVNEALDVTSGSASVSAVHIIGIPSSTTVGTPSPNASLNPLPVSVLASDAPLGVSVDAATITTKTNLENASTNFASEQDEHSVQDLEEAKRTMPVTAPISVTPGHEKVVDEEQAYVNKQEAKNAFKALLESNNIQSDWSWEQAMRVIINDKRYGALKTLGERKQTFNEYLSQKKKQEVEERRVKHKKARENFTLMLEECKELTSSTRWSKAVAILEGDDRFSAVERPRDREELFETYISDLQKKEKSKAAEEHKRNIMEYRTFLKSCDFIKANSQWRKVQERLEEDERCSQLEKFDRLKIFQEYVQDLEKEEEELRKIQKEQLRREERKNRDDFRKLLEEHVSLGTITAKTHWREYCMKVKDLPTYLTVASNTSGATPKDLFEDVAEEVEKQYREDKTEIKDAMKMGKLTLMSKSTFEDFKKAISEVDSLLQISKINLKLAYDELLERLKEKEEKEGKKRQRLAENFSNLLFSIKEITSSSSWEECKPLFEDSEEYRSLGEESLGREVFAGYIVHLQEKVKERERKRDEEKVKKEKEKEDKEKRKEKERKEKEREWDKDKERERHRKDDFEDDEDDGLEAEGFKEDGKREKGKDRKHQKRRHRSSDAVSSDQDDKEESKRSRRHSSDRRKSRKHGFTMDSDTEVRQKRHKKDRDGYRKSSAYEELEDGELGEDGEIR